MKRRTFIHGVAAGALTLGATGSVTAAERTETTLVATDDGDVRTRLERAGYTVRREILEEKVYAVTGGAPSDLESIDGVSRATSNLRLEFEAPAATASVTEQDEPGLYDLQWDKHVTEAVPAHEYATGSGTRIAIIDTGIDDSHPDLENVNTDLSAKFREGEVLPHEGDPHGHGTHVAGTAAATGEVGVIGTAPDAELVSLQMFYFVEPDDPEDDPVLVTTTEDLLNAVVYAAEIGADAANLSLGTQPLPPEFNAGGYRGVLTPVYQYAATSGTVLTASAGNSETDLQGGHFVTPSDLPATMSISATGPNDELAFYSNYGQGQVDVAAPGGGYETEEKSLDPDADVEWPYPTNLVLSTVPGGGYAYMAGTSMAAPQVAGIVGLLRELEPDANPNRIERFVKGSADGDAGESDPERGAGRVNALSAVEDR